MSNNQSTIQLIHLMPDDVIVARHSEELNPEQLKKVERSLVARFPANPILVHDSRITLSIHRPPPVKS